ncbi:MAG TPA: hypothetical protein VK986_15225 [Tepidisphaeraceae bacterium]|nr:hypothetical protein [Tepidisphaeraceae bacterium]
MSEPTPILMLCRDLMFTSKVMATARAAGVPLRTVRDPGQLPAEGRKLIVDLTLEGALEAAGKWKQGAGGVVIAFAPHVDVETMRAAREVGLDQVLTRGAFTAQLESLIKDPV